MHLDSKTGNNSSGKLGGKGGGTLERLGACNTSRARLIREGGKYF